MVQLLNGILMHVGVVDNWNMEYNGCGINVLSCTIACIHHYYSMITLLEIRDIHWL